MQYNKQGVDFIINQAKSFAQSSLSPYEVVTFFKDLEKGLLVMGVPAEDIHLPTSATIVTDEDGNRTLVIDQVTENNDTTICRDSSLQPEG